ncbi:MAG: zinc ribbon domain-containing protein [Cyanobacteriota bacterium]|nr:zinc ribbon domain-containing protein [Cyanobacteriota bacterium]
MLVTAQGVQTVLVNPAYSSQTCHSCLHIHPIKGQSYRKGKRFKCENPSCGWIGDADENGSLMIKILGGVVSHPESSIQLSCKIS